MVFEDTLAKNAVSFGESVGVRLGKEWLEEGRKNPSLSGICSLRDLRSRYAPLHIPCTSPVGPWQKRRPDDFRHPAFFFAESEGFE